MPGNVIMEDSSWATHEPDEWYSGELVRIDYPGDFGYGDTIRFVIQLDDEDGETWALTSQKLSPKTKLYRWVKAIDERLIPEVGKALQLTNLEGRRVEVMFEQGDERERVVKIRKEGKAVTAVPGAIQGKQAQSAKAKRPTVVEDDEAPF